MYHEFRQMLIKTLWFGMNTRRKSSDTIFNRSYKFSYAD